MCKKILWSAVICMAVSLIWGCQAQMHEFKKTSIDKKSVSAYAGTWECVYPARWTIVFDEDGMLKYVLHNTGFDFVMAEGGTTEYGPNNEIAMFVLGPCHVQSGGNDLNMTFNIDYYKMELPQGALEGKIKDTFMGKLSEDGKIWDVKWYCYSWMVGAIDPPIKIINENPVTLVFDKTSNSTDLAEQKSIQ